MAKNAKLLDQVNSLLQDMPDKRALRSNKPDTLAWLGRLEAIILNWESVYSSGFQIKISQATQNLLNMNAQIQDQAYRTIICTLHTVRNDILIESPELASSFISKGETFKFFDGVRKIIDTAQDDILFIDPYINANFVSQYLPLIERSVSIRLLTSSNKEGLAISLSVLSEQYQFRKLEARANKGIHDRFILIDGSSCFQSGTSFKDGAKNNPTSITTITDIANEVINRYENLYEQSREFFSEVA